MARQLAGCLYDTPMNPRLIVGLSSTAGYLLNESAHDKLEHTLAARGSLFLMRAELPAQPRSEIWRLVMVDLAARLPANNDPDTKSGRAPPSRGYLLQPECQSAMSEVCTKGHNRDSGYRSDISSGSEQSWDAPCNVATETAGP